MKNYYELAKSLNDKKVSVLESGLVIVNSVLDCYKNPEAKRLYQRGEIKAFRNREQNSVLSDLYSIVEREKQIITPEEIVKNNHENLQKYIEIYEINCVFDALKFFYLHNQDINELASFLGKNFLGDEKNPGAMLLHENISEYELKKDYVKSREYLNYINSLRKGLKKQFRARF